MQLPMKMRLWALGEILKRYSHSEKVEVPNETVVDMVIVIFSEKATHYQKKAARMVLDYVYGEKTTDLIIEENAIVTDRNDRLVRKWRMDVIKRDGKCMNCAREYDLHAHHISHWSDDPVNRINLRNGITLCTKCHAAEHPELEKLILSRV